MHKIAHYKGTLMSLVLLEEKLASLNGLYVWKCSCGSKFMTVYYASFHCEKNHRGEKFKDFMTLRNDLPTDTKLWNVLYTAVSDNIVKTIGTDVSSLCDSISNKSVELKKSIKEHGESEGAETKSSKRKSTDSSSEPESKRDKSSYTDIGVNTEVEKTKVCVEIGPSTENLPSSEKTKVCREQATMTKEAKQNPMKVRKINRGTQVNLKLKKSAKSPELCQSSTTKNVNKSTNIVEPVVIQNNVQNVTETKSFINVNQFSLIMRPELPFPIPDPISFPYPNFGLVYEYRLLLRSDGTPTVFYWHKLAEYYENIKDTDVDTFTARTIWRQQYATKVLFNSMQL